MAAVGLSTDVSVLRGVGPQPFVAGMTGALAVACTGYAAAWLVGDRLAFGNTSSTPASSNLGDSAATLETKSEDDTEWTCCAPHSQEQRGCTIVKEG